jgi:hypothetical protein
VDHYFTRDFAALSVAPFHVSPMQNNAFKRHIK